MKVSILDLAMVTSGNTAADAFSQSVDLARQGEKLGYTRFWLAEHHNMEGVASSATAVLIAHVAGKTGQIRVGSGGIMLPNHAPLIIAEQFGTLATLFPGRIDLGIGRAPGTDSFTAAALRRDHKSVLNFEDNVQELQKYLSEKNKNGPVRAIPGEGLDIPVWILGSSTDSAYLAAKMGLPYAFASHFAPAYLLEASKIYRANFKASPYCKQPYFMPCINIIAADSDSEAQWLATSFKMLFLGILTGERKKMGPPQHPAGLFELHEEAALRQMIHYSFIGSAESVAMQLQPFMDVVKPDEIMVSTPVYDHRKRLHSYEIVMDI